MHSLLLLWFLVGLFCLAALGVLLTDFTPDADLESRLTSLGFTTVFLFAAFHFVSLAIPPSTA